MPPTPLCPFDMNLAQRKSEELLQKVAAFGQGVDEWLKERRAQPAFKIHSSQLNAVEALLSGVRGGIARELNAAAKNGSVLAQAMSIETMILAAYQIWEFYRPKMAQRMESQFQNYLRIADEFAWHCYRPVRDRVFGGRPEAKEPPLVYLNAEWSPFVKERSHRYQVEGAPSALFARQPDFSKAVAQLPFPVIGVPWFQAGFLPGGLTIAHEVGHVIIADCGLHGLLGATAEGVKDASRQSQWEAWSEEMFADTYGCLAVGPAFAFSLSGTLAADRATVDSAQEVQYPPHSLRIRLNQSLLAKTGHQRSAAELWDDWSSQYPEPHPWSAFEEDIDTVAEGLLNVSIPLVDGRSAPLRTLLSFPSSSYDAAKTFAEETRQNVIASAPDLRVRWAAAQIVYRSDPSGFVKNQPSQANFPNIASRFLDRMRKVCLDNLRSGEVLPNQDRLRYLTNLGESLLKG
jgi:hypothetical protein